VTAKAILPVAVALLSRVVLPAAGQTGHSIDLYADPTYAITQAFDLTPGTMTVYVVHKATINGATNSAFRIAASTDFTGVWVEESSPFALVVGTSPTGIEIGYNFGCMFPSALVLEVVYTMSGTSAECSYLEVVAHPNHPEGLNLPDCSFGLTATPGGKLTINPNETCSMVPTEASTWGRVKSLYR
jgi:hypothetical protein